jgi:hypothetical protein
MTAEITEAEVFAAACRAGVKAAAAAKGLIPDPNWPA